MSSPAGGHRPGVYKAHYARYRGGEITVKPGYQIHMKRTGTIAQSKWLGTKKTSDGCAALTKRLSVWRVVFYVNLWTVSLFVAAVAALAVGLGVWRRTSPRRQRRAARALWVVCLAVVLAATVIPDQPIGSGVPYVAMIPGEGLWGNAAGSMFASERHMILVLQVANAAMFVPLGLFAFAAARRPSPLAPRDRVGLPRTEHRDRGGAAGDERRPCSRCRRRHLQHCGQPDRLPAGEWGVDGDNAVGRGGRAAVCRTGASSPRMATGSVQRLTGRQRHVEEGRPFRDRRHRPRPPPGPVAALAYGRGARWSSLSADGVVPHVEVSCLEGRRERRRCPLVDCVWVRFENVRPVRPFRWPPGGRHSYKVERP